MTNQAAQTMPTVPQAFFDEFGVNADDRVMDYGRACYAAALSQTAGVPDRKTLFEQAEVLAACYRLKELVEGVGCERWQNANGFRLKDTQQWVEFYNVVNRMQRLEYPPAAAPAASGVHPDALQDGTLSKSTAKRLASASVSERARVSKQVHDMLIDLRAAASIGRPITGDELHELEQDILRALEQALTQQRGEVAWKHDAESWGNALNEAAWIFVDQCPEKSALLFNNTKAPLRAAILKYAELVGAATTPQPSADAVREIYDAAAKGFHTSETNGAERKYLHFIRFQSIEDLHGYEDAWTAAMVKARDAK